MKRAMHRTIGILGNPRRETRNGQPATAHSAAGAVTSAALPVSRFRFFHLFLQLTAALLLLLAVDRGTSHACAGAACMQVWSTADGGGALAIEWDFTKKVDDSDATLCTPDNAECIYATTTDYGFMAPTDDIPGDAYYRLVDGVTISIEIVTIDNGLTVKINDTQLSKAMDSAHLGTMPTIHVHPTWILDVPGSEFKDYRVSYKLTSDSVYGESAVYTQIVTNIPPLSEGTPTPSPSPTPTGFRQPCNGDCDGNAAVTAAEIVQGVGAVAHQERSLCIDLDANRDGVVDDVELLAATRSLFEGCGNARPATLNEVQGSVFTPTCATLGCHDALTHNAALVLSPDQAFNQLVGVEPDTFAARSAGLLRVDPGDIANSFLVIKLEGPAANQGGKMPVTGSISPDDVQLIRDWIERGALP